MRLDPGGARWNALRAGDTDPAARRNDTIRLCDGRGRARAGREGQGVLQHHAGHHRAQTGGENPEGAAGEAPDALGAALGSRGERAPAGGIPQAIAKTKQYLIDNNKDLKIIVEARNLDEVQQILDAGGVYRILLDNFDYETTKKAVAMIGNQCLTESSGNINEKTIRNYAECGVNYISSGALTHSVYNMDLSLKAI